MILTVFVTTNSDKEQWRAELLEHSWQQAGQPGELIRLVACSPDQDLPLHGLARVVRTRPWSPHPYIPDQFAAYNIPASLLEWVTRERIDATLLLLDEQSILLKAAGQEIEPGEAVGNTWIDMPAGADGPFGLPKEYKNLQAYCVNRSLKLPQVQFPLLIHSREVKKIAARWLELIGIIRSLVTTDLGPKMDAGKLAYAIAAAEYRVPHKARKLVLTPGDKKSDKAILDFSQPIESPKGKIVWDTEAYVPWQSCEPKEAQAGVGRRFLNFLQEYATLRESFGHLQFRRPRRCFGVREAKILDRMLLEVPGQPEPLTLNSSAAAIWNLCDGKRTLADIADELERTFEVPRQVLGADIELAINQLHSDGAIVLEIAS